MRLRRIWQIKLALAACMMAALIAVGGRSLAQMRQAEQFDRDERRIERKVESLQKDHDELKLSLEKRLVRIETYLDAQIWLIGALVVAVLAQLSAGAGKAWRELRAERQAAGKKEGS